MASPGHRFRLRAKGRMGGGQGAMGGTPFASFMERHKDREHRARGKRRMLLISLGVHIAVFGMVWLFSAWQVDELFGRRVEVRLSQQAPEPGPDGKQKHKDPANIGRALGIHLVVTPTGAKTEPRTDGIPAIGGLSMALAPTVLPQLLASLRYPLQAQQLKLRASVSVLVDVDDEGKITQLDIKMPCANELLCVATKTAVAQITRWPTTAVTHERSFLVPVEYRPQ